MKTLIIGAGINQVKKFPEKCYAIDISQEYLDVAKKYRPNNIYIKADVQDLPFQNNFFDKIIFTHVLEHVTNPEKAISEIWRVLKKNGKLFLEVPSKEREDFLSKHNLIFNRDVKNGFHKSQYTKNILKEKLKSFSSVQIKTISGRDIVFWYLWGKFINMFSLKNNFYIEECGQIHSKKRDFITKQFSRILFLINIVLSPIIFRNLEGEYHAIAIK